MTRLRFVVGLVAVAALVAGCGGSNPSKTASTPSGGSTGASSSPSATTEPAMLGGGKVTLGANVPWSRVGQGWYLSLVTQGKTGPNGESLAHAVLLDLVDPLGGRYQMLKLPTSPQRPMPELVSWSADGRNALLVVGERTENARAVRVDLTTGRTATLALPRNAAAVEMLPDASGVLVQRAPLNLTLKAQGEIVRMGWDGSSIAIWPHATTAVLVSPDGQQILTGGQTARDSTMTALGRDGTQERVLEMAQTCRPIRWWDASTALVTCTHLSGNYSHLYLVPLDTLKPRKLTTARDGSHGPDLLDLDARKLGNRLFLQAAGPCGYEFLAEQPPHRPAVQVDVPRAKGNVHLVGTHDDELVLQTGLSCDGGGVRSAFLELDPASGKERVLDTLPADEQFATLIGYGEVRATEPD